MNRILLDCDGVIADFALTVCSLIDNRITPDQIDRWDFFSLLTPEERMRVSLALRKPEHWGEGLQPTPWAHFLVNFLRELPDAELYVVTSPWEGCHDWLDTRFGWLEYHFNIPRDHVIVAKDKTPVHGAVFIDDKPSNVGRWQETWPESEAFLWALPHNRKERGGWTLQTMSSENFADKLQDLRVRLWRRDVDEF